MHPFHSSKPLPIKMKEKSLQRKLHHVTLRDFHQNFSHKGHCFFNHHGFSDFTHAG